MHMCPGSQAHIYNAVWQASIAGLENVFVTNIRTIHLMAMFGLINNNVLV